MRKYRGFRGRQLRRNPRLTDLPWNYLQDHGLSGLGLTAESFVVKATMPIMSPPPPPPPPPPAPTTTTTTTVAQPVTIPTAIAPPPGKSVATDGSASFPAIGPDTPMIASVGPAAGSGSGPAGSVFDPTRGTALTAAELFAQARDVPEIDAETGQPLLAPMESSSIFRTAESKTTLTESQKSNLKWLALAAAAFTFFA